MERHDLLEICGNCGQVWGSHHAGQSPWPYNYCPDPDCRMDWKNGPGTVFKSTGRYERAYAEDKEQISWRKITKKLEEIRDKVSGTL